ncbi:hypothetical protein HOY80DRAFT_1058107 [Tuber brumale]|nr:hypothetical protein HOY80DRAFT_1058107 [Tuber brumale]
MGFRKSHSSIKAVLATATVLQQLVEKSLTLESENSKLRHHVSVLSWRLQEVIAELKVDCVDWVERVEEEEKRFEKVEFAGCEDMEPLVMDKEVAVVEAKKFVVRLPVAMVELVAGAEVVEDGVRMEVAGKGKEVAVVAEKAEDGISSREGDWMVVKSEEEDECLASGQGGSFQCAIGAQGCEGVE